MSFRPATVVSGAFSPEVFDFTGYAAEYEAAVRFLSALYQNPETLRETKASFGKRRSLSRRIVVALRAVHVVQWGRAALRVTVGRRRKVAVERPQGRVCLPLRSGAR